MIKTQKFNCNQCDRVFDRERSLRMHKIRSHGPGWSTTKNFKGTTGRRSKDQPREERLAKRREYQHKLRERYYAEGRDSKGALRQPGWKPQRRKKWKWSESQRKRFDATWAAKRRNGPLPESQPPAETNPLGDAAKAILLAAKVLRGTITALKLPIIIGAVMLGLMFATTAFAHLGDTPEQEKAHFFGPPLRTVGHNCDIPDCPYRNEVYSMTFLHNEWCVEIEFVDNRAVQETWTKIAAWNLVPEWRETKEFSRNEIEPLIQAYDFLYDGKAESETYWRAGDYWMRAGSASDSVGFLSVTVMDSRYEPYPDPAKIKARREQTKSTFN